MQDKESVPLVSELEGAILTELAHRGEQTAFRVRRSFAVSPSLEWRGSAGSVYAAIKRLERAGLIGGRRTGDRRATRLLSITDAGRAAWLGWADDVSRAISVGIDPFRLRAGVWLGLSPGDAAIRFDKLEMELEANITALRGYSRNDDLIERAGVDLAIRTQQARLAWLRDLRLLRRSSSMAAPPSDN